jgi:hypothetical protein
MNQSGVPRELIIVNTDYMKLPCLADEGEVRLAAGTGHEYLFNVVAFRRVKQRAADALHLRRSRI